MPTNSSRRSRNNQCSRHRERHHTPSSSSVESSPERSHSRQKHTTSRLRKTRSPSFTRKRPSSKRDSPCRAPHHRPRFDASTDEDRKSSKSSSYRKKEKSSYKHKDHRRSSKREDVDSTEEGKTRSRMDTQKPKSKSIDHTHYKEISYGDCFENPANKLQSYGGSTTTSNMDDHSNKEQQSKPFMVPLVGNQKVRTTYNSPSFMQPSQSVEQEFSSTCYNFPADLTNQESSASNEQCRKRRSRWAESDNGRTFIPGLPTTLPPNLTKDQEKAYLIQLQIEEITRRLRLPNLGIPESTFMRSPSPEPIYDQHGKRTNTREARTKKKLDDSRHLLVVDMFKLNPEYKPPSDYKPQQIRYTDKVDIPQDDFPEINFVGLLIGPRGNSLKNLEKETGAKIIIRGKGSVKDGKLARKEAGPMPGEDEPLHAYITGTTLEVVEKAKKRIHEIIQQGIEVPESMNELRRMQLRELALLNGTLRENECLNKLKILTEAETIVTNTIICPICGNAGHIASDCMLRSSLTKEQIEKLEQESVDTEYSALMKELGHTVSAHQLKCLSGVIATGALTLGHSGLALPPIEERINENGETEITLMTSLDKLGQIGNTVLDEEIPPLMSSGRLRIPKETSNSSTLPLNPEINKTECVINDPAIAMAAAALKMHTCCSQPSPSSTLGSVGDCRSFSSLMSTSVSDSKIPSLIDGSVSWLSLENSQQIHSTSNTLSVETSSQPTTPPISDCISHKSPSSNTTSPNVVVLGELTNVSVTNEEIDSLMPISFSSSAEPAQSPQV